MKDRISFLFLLLILFPAISAAQKFQDLNATSKSYGHISQKTKTWVWEPDSTINVGVSFDYDKLIFQFFGPQPQLLTLLTTELIKDNKLNTRTYRCDAVDMNGNPVMVIYSQLKNAAEVTIVQKDQTAVRFRMIELQTY